MSITSDAIEEKRRKEAPQKEREALAKKHLDERVAMQDSSDIIKDTIVARHAKERERAPQEEALDPTEGMDNYDKFAAGMGRGAVDIAQNVGNVLGIVEDETITDRRRLDEPLMDTGAGMVGSLVGETAALAPVGIIGKGAQLLHKALKGGKAMTAIPKVLTGALEGAAAGGIIGGPDNRKSGAALGAGAGGILTGAGQAVARTFKDGLVKNTAAADDLINIVEKELGRKSFAPVGLTAESAGGATSTATKGIATDVLGFFPSAKGQFQGQTERLTNDIYETFIRKAFKGRGAKGGKAALASLKAKGSEGDMLKAMKAAQAAGSKMNTPAQRALWKAVNNNNIGKGRFLHGEAEKGINVNIMRSAINDVEKDIGGDILGGAYRELVDATGETLQRAGSGSSPYTRGLFYQGQGAATDAIGGAANLVAGLPAHWLSSVPVQKFLQGKGRFLQKGLQKAFDSGNLDEVESIMAAIRREMSATATEPDPTMNSFATQALRAGGM